MTNEDTDGMGAAVWASFAHLVLWVAVAVAAALFLTGCAQYGMVKKVVAENGEQAKDEALEAAEWYMCNAASVGAVKRRYTTPEQVASYNVLCPGRLPVEPEQ